MLGVILVQVAVPTFALFQDKPARFGFQMYSGYGAGSITVLDTAGGEIAVDWSEQLPRTLRPELDWTTHLPEHACASIEGAADVIVEQDLTGRTVVSCTD